MTNNQESDVPTFKDTVTDLRKPLEPSQIRQRPGSKDRNGNILSFDYVPWNEVANILDDKATGWNHSIKGMQVIGDLIAITVAITIGDVTREGVGTGRASDETGIKKAEHDALKRAAVKFGIARELYSKEIQSQDTRPGSSGSQQANIFDFHTPPSSPKATGEKDLITSRQLNMINSLSRELNMNPYDECADKLKCKVDDLNRKAASWFISYLQELQKGNDAANQAVTASNNVTNISRSAKPTVSPETRAKMMIDNGDVAPSEDGFDVTDQSAMGSWVAKVSINREQNIVTCTCGEYKMAAYKNEPGFMCVHKIAVEKFTQRETDAS